MPVLSSPAGFLTSAFHRVGRTRRRRGRFPVEPSQQYVSCAPRKAGTSRGPNHRPYISVRQKRVRGSQARTKKTGYPVVPSAERRLHSCTAAVIISTCGPVRRLRSNDARSACQRICVSSPTLHVGNVVMITFGRGTATAAIVFVCSAMGCSGSSSSSVPAGLVEVRGTVTLGKTPLPHVMVALVPVGEGGTGARGVTDGTGRYTLRHASGRRRGTRHVQGDLSGPRG